MLSHLTEFSPKWPVKVFHFKQQESTEGNQTAALFSEPIWKIDYLEHLKQALNSVKQELENKDLTDWSQHTSVTDASAWIRQEVAAKVVPAPEMLTRAWLKQHEILSSFPVVQVDTGQPVRCLFLCEAPGAFVSAVNHFIHSRSKSDNQHDLFQWMATSLNPYCSDVPSGAITDDSLMRFTLNNWFFGDDNKGNILSPYFLPALSRIVEKDGKFDFVTGDGGMNFVNDPSNQVNSDVTVIELQYIFVFFCCRKRVRCL